MGPGCNLIEICLTSTIENDISLITSCLTAPLGISRPGHARPLIFLSVFSWTIAGSFGFLCVTSGLSLPSVPFPVGLREKRCRRPLVNKRGDESPESLSSFAFSTASEVAGHKPVSLPLIKLIVRIRIYYFARCFPYLGWPEAMSQNLIVKPSYVKKLLHVFALVT